jgi:hypothetical protein
MRADMQMTTAGRRFAQFDDLRVYLQHPDPMPENQVYVDYAGLLPLVLDAVRESEASDQPLPVCLRSGPGNGKNELVRAVARALGKPSYTTQGSTDCAAQDLVVFPVPADGNRFDAVASGICTACIAGGLALFDEAGKVARFAQEAMTPLASLLDDRRVLWSDFLKRPFSAAPGFAFICTTQSNETLPDYVTSRMVTFDIPPPSPEALMEILKAKLPAVPGILISAFRDWASMKVGLTPRDAVLILHFACRRLRADDMKTLRAKEATSLIQTVSGLVLAKGGTQK